MRLLIAIAATAALAGSAFAADLGPVPGKPRQHTTQRYAPVPDQDDNYAMAPAPQSAPTCPNQQYAGAYGAQQMCAGAAYGSPCGAGYGYGAYGYGVPVAYPVWGGGYGGYGFRGGFRGFRGRH